MWKVDETTNTATLSADGLPDVTFSAHEDGVRMRVDSSGDNLLKICPSGGHWEATLLKATSEDSYFEIDGEGYAVLAKG